MTLVSGAWHSCPAKDTLGCGDAFVSVAADVATLIETAVDIKEVSYLGELVFR